MLVLPLTIEAFKGRLRRILSLLDLLHMSILATDSVKGYK